MKRFRNTLIASIVVLYVIAIGGLIGCASFVDNTYKTLYVAGQGYDAGMKTIADLQSQGKITVEQRAQINDYAGKFYTSYQVAAAALSTYNKTKTAADEEKLATAITDLVRTWKVYAQAVNAFAPDALNVEVK